MLFQSLVCACCTACQGVQKLVNERPYQDPNEPEAPDQSPEETSAEEQSLNDDQQTELTIIEKLKGENDSLKDALMRSMAEAQNIQRRLRQQMLDDRKYAIEPLVRDLIPVLDNFNRTLLAAEKASNIESLIEGVRAVERQLLKALEGAQVTRIPSTGSTFDPEVHEAIVTVETNEVPHDTVLDEVEPGYMLHDRVVRPSRVRVAVKP